MSSRTESLQAKASTERARLSASFDALEREVDELTDWRTHVRRDPLKPLAVAAVAGVLLGAATTTRSRQRSRPLRQLLSARGKSLPVSTAAVAMMKYAGALALELLAARALGTLRKQPARRPE